MPKKLPPPPPVEPPDVRRFELASQLFIAQVETFIRENTTSPDQMTNAARLAVRTTDEFLLELDAPKAPGDTHDD